MADFDKFDRPTYGGQEVDIGSEGIASQLTAIVGPIKSYLPYIIGAIVVLAIAFFVYDYFVASVVQVTVTLKDTEGRLLEGNELKIFAEGSNAPIFEDSGASTYAVSLRAGKYVYEASVPGSDYKTKKGSFEVSQKSREHEIRLVKDIEVEILGLEQSFPSRLYIGGTREFSVGLKNHSSSTAQIELEAEGDIIGLVDSGIISVPGNGTKDVTLSVEMSLGTSIEDLRNGDEKQAVLRVKYTSNEAKADFVLYPNPRDKISVNEASLNADAIEGDNKDEVEIKVRNRNSFPIEGITLSIEITSSRNNSSEEVLSWLQFTEIANQSNPREIEISSIPAGDTVEKELQLVLPLTAKEEPDIKGNIVIEAPFLSEPIKNTLTISVDRGAKYGIELSSLPGSPVDIEWNDALEKYEDKVVNLKVKNTGQLELQNLVFSIANPVVCSSSWLEFVENTIDSLDAGATKELMMTASAPLAMRNYESPKLCNIRYRYYNPIVAGAFVEDTEVGFIEIVPKP